MRIKVNSDVEVWTPDPAKPPNGAWRAGVVTWGNGHTYIMRWLDGGPDSGRIKRQFVRPCPPPVPLPVNLAAGDTVEVLDNNLWKLAEVVGDGNRQYEVKITGSSKVLMVDRVQLRVQQRLTEDDLWVVVNKDNNNEQSSAVPARPIAGKHIKSKSKTIGISSPLKLGPGKRSHAMMESDIACRDEIVNSINKRVRSGASGQSAASSSSSSSSDNDGGSSSSSDGSTDSNRSSNSNSSRSRSSNGSNRNNNSGGDRAVSACQHESAAVQQLPVSCNKDDECPSADRTVSRASAGTHHRPIANKKPLQEEEQRPEGGDGRAHEMELEAYVSVMKVFHASGPLDWEKEELLSNLRVHLQISRDEHLKVIWHLKVKKKPPAGAPCNGSS